MDIAIDILNSIALVIAWAMFAVLLLLALTCGYLVVDEPRREKLRLYLLAKYSERERRRHER